MVKEFCIILFFTWVFSLDAAYLTWDENPPEDNVSGYKVYWGPSSRNYVGNEEVRNGVIFQLPTDRFYATDTYYFAVTAFRDSDGLESEYSNEVFWTVPMRMKATPNLITVNVKPGDNYVLERTSDFISWLGVDARTADSSNLVFTVPSSLDSNFYRLKKLEPEPLFAMASASKSMEKGLLVSVTDSKLKTKESLTRKVKKFFKYNRRYEPDYRKGAELLLAPKKQMLGAPSEMLAPPMPVRVK